MKSKQLPSKIKILDQIFDIIYVEKISEVDGEGIKSVLGQADLIDHKIRIYKPKGYSGSEVWNTIFHEMIHVICEVLKIEEIIEKDDKSQERIVNLLATGLNTTMIDNKFCFKDINS